MRLTFKSIAVVVDYSQQSYV